jgi:hypothetical protein
MDMNGGGYRRALRWANLVLLLVGIVLAILFGPF